MGPAPIRCNYLFIVGEQYSRYWGIQTGGAQKLNCSKTINWNGSYAHAKPAAEKIRKFFRVRNEVMLVSGRAATGVRSAYTTVTKRARPGQEYCVQDLL